jgi:hypothetical protein
MPSPAFPPRGTCPPLSLADGHNAIMSIPRSHHGACSLHIHHGSPPHQADRAAAGPGPACALLAGRHIPARQTAAPAGRPGRASPLAKLIALLRRRRRFLRLDGGVLRERTDMPLGRLAAARRAAATPDALWTALIIAPRLSTSEGADWSWWSMTDASWGRHSGSNCSAAAGAPQRARPGKTPPPERICRPGRGGWHSISHLGLLSAILVKLLLQRIGMWRSLVARVVRDDEVAGSNPVIPTREKEGLPIGRPSFLYPAPVRAAPRPGPAAWPRAPSIKNSPGTGSRLSRGCEALASLDVTSGRASCRR